MQVTEEDRGDLTILRVEGRIDSTSSPILDKKVNALIDEGHHRLLLNLENVEYVSSAGMRLFLSATKKLKSLGGAFIVCAPTEDVMDVIKMAGFHHILTIVSSEKKALNNNSK